MALLLLLGPEIEKCRGQDRQRGNVEGGGHLVGQGLLGEGVLVGTGEALAAVLDRVAETGEAAIEEEALEPAGPLPHLVLGGQQKVGLPLGQTGHVVGQPPARPQPEVFDILGRRQFSRSGVLHRRS